MLEILKQSEITIIAVSFGFSAFVIAFLTYSNRVNKKLPPGPRSLPFVGNLLLLSKGNILQTFRDLRSKYGDFYSLKLGCHDVIVINGYETLKELLVKRGSEVSERPDTFVFKNIALGQGKVSILTQ